MTEIDLTAGKPGHKGLTRILKATGFSINGFKAVCCSEEAFRQELILMIIGTVSLFFLTEISITLRAIMWISLAAILIVEILNSAIEAVVDRISTDYHELSGRAKDMGSAAVLLTIVAVLVEWALIIFEHYS